MSAVDETKNLNFICPDAVNEAVAFHDELAPRRSELRDYSTPLREVAQRPRRRFDFVQQPSGRTESRLVN